MPTGVDPLGEVVRDVLVHQQIATTATYLHATDERKEGRGEAASPRGVTSRSRSNFSYLSGSRSYAIPSVG